MMFEVPSLARWSFVASMVLLAVDTTEGQVPPPADVAPEVRLAADHLELPLVMVREFPFVSGAVSGVRGKLMLDTGTQPPLIINHHYVPLDKGIEAEPTHYGSGQTVTSRMSPLVSDVRIGPLSFPTVHNVKSNDARMLESVTPDFLGFLGFTAWHDHVLKLDYYNRRAIFDRRIDRSLRGEQIIASFRIVTRRVPNVPIVTMTLGGADAAAIIDTGAYGSIFTSASVKRRLVAAGTLKPEANGKFTVVGLKLAGHILPDIPHMQV